MRSSIGGTVPPTRSSTTSTTGEPKRCGWTSCGSVRRRREPSARIVTGAGDDLITELAALADEEPLRERPRALLMEALARAGRNVEALRVYDDFRRLLGDELGIEPSPALTAQHADLLDRHWSRDVEPREPAAGPGHVARRARRRSWTM